MLSKLTSSYQGLKLFDWNTHPIKVIETIVNHYGQDIEFEFSRYKYIPQSLEDKREIFNMNGSMLSRDYVATLFSELNEGEELALHSKILINNQLKHIPMIDLSAKSTARAIKGLMGLLPKNISSELVFFNSGRSFHAYSTCLIDNENFPSFLGRLLLSNQVGEPLLVDSRWVGHRLVGGYLSLRWSCNTKNYVQYPKKVNGFSN